ncbi:dehydrogenase [Embleya sp. AB8]|uniref:dehydrogenase n=1 Tax=Embleya sp. AB8 TaxID=3156304 RepID=UPI003C76D7A8
MTGDPRPSGWRADNPTLVRRGVRAELTHPVILESPDGRLPLRILRAGVCGTDLQIQRGVRADVAEILGHEGLALDENRGSVRPVVFNPVDPAAQDRILGHSRDGIFRRYVPAPEPDDPELVDVRPELVADLAPLIEPLAAVLYGWDLLSPAGRPATVGIWGAGSTALLAAVVGELYGVETHLVHPRADRLRFVAALDVLGRTGLSGAAGRPGGPKDLHAAFLCLPREAAPAALAAIVEALAPDGMVDLLGGFGSGDRHPAVLDPNLDAAVDLGAVRRANVCGRPDPGRHTDARTPQGRIRLVGHRGTAAHHLAAAQHLLVEHRARFTPLVTHVLSLTAARVALPAVARRARPAYGPDERVKMVIDPTLDGDTWRPPDAVTTVGDLCGAR